MPSFWVSNPRRPQHFNPTKTICTLALYCLCTTGVYGKASFVENALHKEEDMTRDKQHLVNRYIPDFAGLDRGIIGRADDEIQTLVNNAPGEMKIGAGEAQFWTFPKSAVNGQKSAAPTGLPSLFGNAVEGKKNRRDPAYGLNSRQSGQTVFITLNTCDQPVAKSPSRLGAPAQLGFYISTSSDNPKPDAESNSQVVSVDGGWASVNMTADSDIYIGISAPSDDAFSGSYDYEITASIDDAFAKYNDSTVSYFLDSDNHAALIWSYNTTNCSSNASDTGFWMNQPPRFNLFVFNQEDSGLLGLEKSMCGLKNKAQVQGSSDIDMSMTLAGGGCPKQQFYAKGLNGSSAYYAVIGLEGTDGTSGSIGPKNVNGGGTIWQYFNFTTKSSKSNLEHPLHSLLMPLGPNCALLYDLDFCSEVAYAVPSNAELAHDQSQLANYYDNYTSQLLDNFNKSIAQIPCNTTSSAQYSLAVTCDDCRTAYKNWLCAVNIPRCEGFDNTASYLQPRAVNQSFIDQTYGNQFTNDPSLSKPNMSVLYMNSSRAPRIDVDVKPGPYKELLPCADLCYSLVRSCPASLGFSCPLEGHGLAQSYGKHFTIGTDQYGCSAPYAYLLNAASSAPHASFPLVMTALAVLTLILSWMTKDTWFALYFNWSEDEVCETSRLQSYCLGNARENLADAKLLAEGALRPVGHNALQPHLETSIGAKYQSRPD